MTHLPSRPGDAESRQIALELLGRLDGLRVLLAHASGGGAAVAILEHRSTQLKVLSRRAVRGGRVTPAALLAAVARVSAAADQAGLPGCALTGI